MGNVVCSYGIPCCGPTIWINASLNFSTAVSGTVIKYFIYLIKLQGHRFPQNPRPRRKQSQFLLIDVLEDPTDIIKKNHFSYIELKFEAYKESPFLIHFISFKDTPQWMRVGFLQNKLPKQIIYNFLSWLEKAQNKSCNKSRHTNKNTPRNHSLYYLKSYLLLL